MPFGSIKNAAHLVHRSAGFREHISRFWLNLQLRTSIGRVEEMDYERNIKYPLKIHI